MFIPQCNGLFVGLGQKSGTLSNLCPADMIKLKEAVHEAAESGSAMDTIDVLDEALQIKGGCLIHGMEFLEQISSPELKQKLAEKSTESPSHSRINMVLSDLEGQIRNRRLIDPKILEACSYQTIDIYFFKFGDKMRSTDPR